MRRKRGLAVVRKPVPSKEERAREARGVRETSAWALRERAAWALRVLRPALVMGAEWDPRRSCAELVLSGALREVPELSGANCLPGLFAIGFGAQAPASSIHGGTNAKSQDTRKRAAVAATKENRLLEGWWKGKEGVAERA